MKKKKILIVIPSLNSGGAEKSLVTLLNSINYEYIEIDLLIFKNEGVFRNSIPENVNVLKEIPLVNDFRLPLLKSVTKLLNLNKKLIIPRLIYSIKYKLSKNKVSTLQKSWKYLSRGINNNHKKYDVALGYLEMWPIYYVVEKVNANVKLGFVHTDYNQYGMDSKFDNYFYEKLDFILTVSESCKLALDKKFPSLKDKVKILENIISRDILFNMSTREKGFNDNFDGIRILTIGRLDFNKGYDLAIKACSKLVEAGFNVRWYAIGEGIQKDYFIGLAKSLNIEKNFIFLGTKENPYPYLLETDMYVHPSRIEGKSIAIEEAKVLCKPIIVTKYETVEDQIINGKHGIIVNIDEESIFLAIKELIDNPILRNSLSLYLSTEDFSNEERVMSTFESLLDKP